MRAYVGTIAPELGQGTIGNPDYAGPWELPYEQILTDCRPLWQVCGPFWCLLGLAWLGGGSWELLTCMARHVLCCRYVGPGSTYVLVTMLQHGVNGELRAQITTN